MSTSMKSVGLIVLSLDLGLAGGVVVRWVDTLPTLGVLDTDGRLEEEEEEEADDERALPAVEESVWGFTVAEESDGARPETCRISAVLRRDVRSSAATVISPLKSYKGIKNNVFILIHYNNQKFFAIKVADKSNYSNTIKQTRVSHLSMMMMSPLQGNIWSLALDDKIIWMLIMTTDQEVRLYLSEWGMHSTAMKFTFWVTEIFICTLRILSLSNP